MQENQLTAEQIQAQSTEKITKKTRYNGETGILFSCCNIIKIFGNFVSFTF